MRSIRLLLLKIIILSPFLISWDGKAQQKYKGYLILSEGDTLRGSVFIPVNKKKELDFSELNIKVEFADSTGKAKIYKPKNTRGYGVHDEENEEINADYVSFNINPPGMIKTTLFLKRVVEGYLQLFEDYYLIYDTYGRNNSLSRSEPQIDYYVLLNNSLVEIPKKDKPGTDYLKVEELKNIFKDYPFILEKLKDKIQWFELKEIISRYNKDKSN